MLHYSMPALAAGFILDLMIGDPRWLYHPVRMIGNMISFFERRLQSDCVHEQVAKRIVNVRFTITPYTQKRFHI